MEITMEEVAQFQADEAWSSCQEIVSSRDGETGFICGRPAKRGICEECGEGEDEMERARRRSPIPEVA